MNSSEMLPIVLIVLSVLRTGARADLSFWRAGLFPIGNTRPERYGRCPPKQLQAAHRSEISGTMGCNSPGRAEYLATACRTWARQNGINVPASPVVTGVDNLTGWGGR